MAVLFLEGQGALDLVHLEEGERVRVVAAAVVIDDNLARTVDFALGDKPSGALGDKPGECDGDEGREHLQQRHASPAPVALNGESAQGDPGSKCST